MTLTWQSVRGRILLTEHNRLFVNSDIQNTQLNCVGADVNMDRDASGEHRTTLLDLPDELIDQILAEVKWGARAPTFDLDGLHFYENLIKNTNIIRNVRATCRRLALRATPLLLPVVSLSISDPSSVDRLEHIAAHPGFGPHVKAVHVYYHFYEAELAADTRKLATYLVWRWTRRLEDESADAAISPPLPGGKTRAEWDRIFKEWAVFLPGQEEKGSEDARANPSELAPEERDESESIRILRREHAEYRRRYEAQRRLGKSFIDRVAKAMAQMPRATRLVLDDAPDTPMVIAAPATTDWLIAPTSWATAFKLGRGSPPIDAVFSLPAAAHRAGVELTGLRIHRLRLPSEFPLWLPPGGLVELTLDEFWDPQWTEAPPPPEAMELQAACQSLRVFDFTPGYEPQCWPSNSPTNLEWPGMSFLARPRTRLDQLLEWILASKSLRQVRIDLQMVHAGIPEELAMPNPPWPHIEVLHLRDGSLEVTALAKFLENTADTLTHLHLDGMNLCSNYVGPFPGTRPPYSWSAVLDLLRAHCRRVREQRCSHSAATGPVTTEPLTVRLRRPDRAEFEDFEVSEEDIAYIRALFDADGDSDSDEGGGLSPVESYIHGLRDGNPLVEAGKTPLLYT